MNILKYLPIVLSGCVSGIILYQSLLIAPSINKLLNILDSSMYLRFIWPKFFIIVSLICTLSFILILIYNPDQNIAKILTLISIFLMVICYFMIPSINEARDSLNDGIFILLHGSSIIMTVITLLLNISVIIYWKY